MKLIDLLVKELPLVGGWPDDAVECCWHTHSNTLNFYDETGNWPNCLTEEYLLNFDLKDVEFEETEQGLQGIKKCEYEQALAKLGKETYSNDPLPPIGTIVQGLPIDAASFEKPFMFIISCIHDGCFIGEAMSGGKVFGELSLWDISPIPSKEEVSREEALFDINKLIGNIEKYPTWRHAVCGIYDAIAAGDIRGLRVE